MVETMTFTAQAIMYGVGSGVVIGTFISVLLAGIWKK